MVWHVRPSPAHRDVLGENVVGVRHADLVVAAARRHRARISPTGCEWSGPTSDHTHALRPGPRAPKRVGAAAGAVNRVEHHHVLHRAEHCVVDLRPLARRGKTTLSACLPTDGLPRRDASQPASSADRLTLTPMSWLAMRMLVAQQCTQPWMSSAL